MKKDILWQKVDKGLNLNIRELLKYQNILPGYFDNHPEIDVDGKHFIYYADNGEEYCGSRRIAYKCKFDGSIIAIKYY